MFKEHRISHYDTDTLAKTKDNRENVEATPRGCPNLRCYYQGYARHKPKMAKYILNSQFSNPLEFTPGCASVFLCRGLLRGTCLAVVGTTTLSFLRKQESRLFEL